MTWLILVVAGLFEVGWAVCLKASRGFTRPWPIAGFAVCTLISLGGLGHALQTIPLGTAYAVWTGVGAVGTVLYGILVLGESADAARIACVGLIVTGIVGLRFLSAH